MMMNYTLAAMTLIRKSKKFNDVSMKQIDTLAKFIESKMLVNEKFGWNDIVSVVNGAK